MNVNGKEKSLNDTVGEGAECTENAPDRSLTCPCIKHENVKLRRRTVSSKQGTTGVEPVTSRSAVECSATELYPLGQISMAMASDPIVRVSEINDQWPSELLHSCRRW